MNKKVILEIGAFMRPDNYILPYLGKDEYDITLVDAQPVILNRLRENVSQYNNVKCFNYGVNIENGFKPFYFCKKQVGCDEGFDSSGTFNWEHYISPKFNHALDDLKVFNVECLTFNNLLDRLNIGNKIELLIVDLETLDFDIIKSIDFSKVDVNTVVYETTHPPRPGLAEETLHYLASNGFKFGKISSLDRANIVLSKTEKGLNLVQ